MPYAVSWYIENEVIYAHYSGEMTADELRDSLIMMRQMIESSSRPLVHVLSDVGDVTQPVSPMESLGIIRKLGTPSQSGWMLVLREKSVVIKFGVALGTTVFKSRNRMFDSLEEAVAFLKDVDTTLSWDKVNTALEMSNA